jgi:hypothetical protein
METASRSKRTLTLSVNKNGEEESIEDCLRNQKGIQINAICTNNPEAAFAALPKVQSASQD